METATPRREAHSAQVKMELRLDGRVLPIAQLGSDFLMLKQPFDHPPAEADIFLLIDDSESLWRVNLVEGIRADQRKTQTVAVSARIRGDAVVAAS